MQSDYHGERKQHNYDEMQQALSVITKQTADVLWDSRARAVAARRFNQIAKLQGPPAPGIIFYILSSFEAKIQPGLYHKHSVMRFLLLYCQFQKWMDLLEKGSSAQA